MKLKNFSLLALFAGMLLLSNCSSPYSGGETGVFTINFGGNAARVVYPGTGDGGTRPNDAELDQLKFTARFLSSSGAVAAEFSSEDGTGVINGAIPTGPYTVEVEITRKVDGTFFAVGDTTYTITQGPNTVLVTVYEAFTVTFDFDDGSAVSRIPVVKNRTIPEPTPQTREGGAGLYSGTPTEPPGYTFGGWYESGTTYNFTTPVTDNITLTAQWTAPTGYTGIRNIHDVLDHVNDYPGTYTLFINDHSISLSGNTNRQLNASGAKLTIIGIGGERTLSLITTPTLTTGRLFTVGAAGETGIELTLGNNITLVGHSANTDSLVYVQNGATFTMLDGSKITGNNTTSSGGGVTVAVDGTFIMNGGSITGNSATGQGGGVDVHGQFTMNGGTITSNQAQQWGRGVRIRSTGTFTINLPVGTSNVIDNTEMPGGYGTNGQVDIEDYATVNGTAFDADNTLANGW